MNDSAPKTLADLKRLPIEQQSLILLERLARIPVREGDGLNKQNLTLETDSWGLAGGFGDEENRSVRLHFLGTPWNRLATLGYIIDPRGQGSFVISEEGRDALNRAKEQSVAPTPTSQSLPSRPWGPDELATFTDDELHRTMVGSEPGSNDWELMKAELEHRDRKRQPNGTMKTRGDLPENAFSLLSAISTHSENNSTPVFVTDLGLNMDEQAAKTAWEYLRDRNLIRTYSLPYSARINSNGTDLLAKISTVTNLSNPLSKIADHTIQPRPVGLPQDSSSNPAETADSAVNSNPPDVTETISTSAQVPSNAPSLSIDLSTISDTPTTDDELGFQPYVTAIAKFLSSDSTKGPLTLSIEGEWGSGKSSFMRQLEKLLAAMPTNLLPEGQLPQMSRTFWFDAWRQDKQEAVWAAFALAFCRRLREKACHKWWAGVRLAYERALTNPDLSGLALASIKVMAWVLGGIFSFTLLSKLGPNWFLQSLLLVTVAAAALMQSFKAAKEVFGSPFETHISEYLRGPDYAQRVAFVEQFQNDFTHMIDAYARNVDKIYVFIDDVDRCEVPKAAELMQAINLLIGDDRRLIFILGMDREKVAAGIAAKYKDLAPYLKKTEVANEIDFGFSFLEKFIQLPFQIPSPSAKSLSTFIEKISPAPRDAVSQTPPLTPIASESPSTSSAPASARQQKIERDLELTGDSEGVREAATMFAVTVSRSPRKVKQFINVFRLRAHIANQLALFDNDDKGAPILTFEQLAKFVAVSLIWPKLVADLDRCPSLLASLEKVAIAPAQAANGNTKPADSEPGAAITESSTAPVIRTDTNWAQVTQLTALLQYGCVERPEWPTKSGRYSLDNVDLVPMLQISPQFVKDLHEKAESQPRLLVGS